MAQFKARKIKGPWAEGYVLDLHTISSTVIGYNEVRSRTIRYDVF